MESELVIPAFILLMVLLAGPIVLFLDVRQQKLLRQIALVTAPSQAQQQAAQMAARDIRITRPTGGTLRRLLFALIGLDPLARQGEIVPVPLVLLAGFVIGTVADFIASLALPPEACLATGVVIGILVIRMLFSWQRKRFADALRRQLPDTIELVVSAVRAGLPVSEAIRGIAREMAEPTRTQFTAASQEISLGRPVDEALMNLYHRTGVTEYAVFAVTVSVQTKSGGRLAETIQTLAETIRQRIAIASRAQALAGEARVSATVLGALPIISSIGLAIFRPGYLEPLLEDPRGRRMLLAAIASLVTGIWTMRQLIIRGTEE